MAEKTIKVTQTRSAIGRLPKHKATLRALGPVSYTHLNPQAQEEGAIITMEAPIDVSNVAIYNPETQKADRVGFKYEDGKKVRFFKSNNKVIVK